MADDNLDLLEKQIETLEKRIFGDADKDSSYPKIVDTLAGLKHQFVNAVANTKKAGPVLNRMGELNDYLDPDFAEPLMTTREAKIESILAEEDHIHQTAKYLENIKDLADVLGSEHIKVVPELEGKLQELSKIHLEQQITMLSKQLVQWDEIVTRLELQSQSSEAED
ncbi:hypothetical protein LSH36_578g00045 [Paralvinella palmiformis]|uniref:Dynactin subunit 3 n=1 Tax=Paralvinella palmiformis TaxID=53620 RepID=A0AAD9J5P5_9ANNE|nr:hypothetical protein LSH36_578g00045 [Paralvinella palmiformis]